MKKNNPFQQPKQLHEMRFIVHANIMPWIEQAFSDDALSTASYELDEDKAEWRLSFFYETLPAKSEVVSRLALIETLANAKIEAPEILPVEEKNWVEETQKYFPPLDIGNFLIVGSHYKDLRKVGKTRLLIDAGAAFGTGEHGTTWGCMEAIDFVMKRGHIHNVLDMGCGTAILGLGVAKRYRVKTLAVDIDPIAIRVANFNITRNGARGHIRAVVGDGYLSPWVDRQGPYDLIIANILAKPLVKMAPQLNKHLKQGGYAILSGLLDWQANMVLHAHRQQGLSLARHTVRNGWSTLVIKKGF
ncbi:MAG: 50S ribosomal protein L11 methyltransferase [Rickettsiales bacterium]